jgi:hypothetical protein
LPPNRPPPPWESPLTQFYFLHPGMYRGLRKD